MVIGCAKVDLGAGYAQQKLPLKACWVEAWSVVEDILVRCKDVERGSGSGGAWAGEGFGGEGEEREMVEETADGGWGGKPAMGGHGDGGCGG